MTLDVDVLAARAARETLSAHPDLARATAEARPKAWGRLAALGIAAYRDLVGRPPREHERRAVWRALWDGAHGER